MEKVVIEHPFHEHPVTLKEIVVIDEESLDCYGCGNGISNLERAYVCVEAEKGCSSRFILHKRCGEFLRKIRHSSHSEHPLYLVDFRRLRRQWCDLCSHKFGLELGYRCDRCDFDLDITCKSVVGRDEVIGGEVRELQHPSHIHPLLLMRKPPLVFNCDACNTRDQDMAYVCSVCELLIHKSCALLPSLLPTNRHRHHHHLSLSSRFPLHHRDFEYKCAVCDKDFDLDCWVYYCGDCRYFAHLKCATSTEQDDFSSNVNQEEINDAGGSILIQFPLEASDISRELITPFVIREIGKDLAASCIIDIDMTKTNASSSSILFNHHKHPLSLICHKDDDGDDDIEEEDDDDEVQMMKICNVCVTPISSPPYYECAACNYFVHSVCNILPKDLSSSSPDQYGDCSRTLKNHKFTRSTRSEESLFNIDDCSFCDYTTNGMVYECEECGMVIDVKCASLPSSIKHASHPHHNRLIKTRVVEEAIKNCYGCRENIDSVIAYKCTKDGCDFVLCLSCVLLPRSAIKREWDKHPLLLTFDASIDHPSDFYCDFCEKQMHPKSWMYHCRPCDNSYHLSCLETTSGWYRNIKFGHQVEFDARLHPHPLTFNYITLRKRCCICFKNVYTYWGFECASCNYVVCRRCGNKHT
ncbi:hypothetical protein C2S52_006052 [Perilla frutescens var. hirtella]|nr:hypothetical protein C2S52_006052 [Perilla frutescens var. hirtella]